METVVDQQCTIHIGEGSLHLADEIPLRQEDGRNCILLCEKQAADLILPPLTDTCPNLRKQPLYFLDASEQNKQIEQLLPLWQAWTRDGIDRSTVVLLIGGGVLCDMGGFAASVYKRGIPFIHIPTTLLAMADASTGGKTAVDIGEIKNIIGCFNRPEAVLVDPVFLKTLPEREFLSGIAEIIKMQLIGNPDFRTEETERCFDRTHFPLRFLHAAIAEKARITAIDFREENLRKTLNFGHTFGHAFESLALKQNRTVPHGYAVAQGILCELYLSRILCNLDREVFESIAELLQRHYGLFSYPQTDIPELIRYMRNDKKNRNGKIFPVLLSAPGHCRYDIAVPESMVEKVLQEYPFF